MVISIFPQSRKKFTRLATEFLFPSTSTRNRQEYRVNAPKPFTRERTQEKPAQPDSPVSAFLSSKKFPNALQSTCFPETSCYFTVRYPEVCRKRLSRYEFISTEGKPKFESYVTDWCPVCASVLDWMKANDIPFASVGIKHLPMRIRKKSYRRAEETAGAFRHSNMAENG